MAIWMSIRCGVKSRIEEVHAQSLNHGRALSYVALAGKTSVIWAGFSESSHITGKLLLIKIKKSYSQQSGDSFFYAFPHAFFSSKYMK